MMKTQVVVLVALAGCFGGGGGSKDPDDKLAGQFDALFCGIGKAGAKDPVRGVRKLGGYLADHGGDMLKNFGDTIAMIERIADDAKHDARALRARNTWIKAISRCEKPWMEFGEAIEKNEEAMGMLVDASERLNRTFEIIFGEQLDLDMRTLPADIARVFSTKLR